MSTKSASGWAIMEKTWEKVQQKTFTKWVNSHLMKRGFKIADLETDFTDGIRLLQFLEIISNQKMPGRMEKRPRMRIQKMQNTSMAMKFIKQLGVNLVAISGEDICDGNLKLILGMIWTIIQKYQIDDITEEELTAKEALLLWCKKKTKNHRDCDITNLHSSFKDGMGFCALIHAHRPDLIDYDSLNKEEDAKNLQLAFDVAEQQLGIPALLDVEDLTETERPDERSVITYLSQYYHYFASNKKGDDAARSVGRLVDLTAAIDKMQNDYAEKAAALRDWTADADGRMKDRTHDGTVEGAQKLVDEFAGYRNEEKPPKAADKAELDSLYNGIQMKLRNARRPPYQAPEGLAPEDLRAGWEQLGQDEKDREEWLRSLLKQQQQLATLNNSFGDKAARMEKWIGEKDAYLGKEEAVDSVPAAESALALCETFPAEYDASKPRLEQVQALADQIVALGDPQADAVAARKAKITGDWEGLQGAYDAKHDDLAAKLALEREKEQLRLDFAKAAKEYKDWTKEAGNEVGDRNFGNSLEAVEAKGAELDASDAQVNGDNDSKKAALDDLWQQMKDKGVTDNRHTAITDADVAHMHEQLADSVKARRTAYDEELARQREMEEMRKKFAEMAQAFVDSVDARRGEVDGQSAPNPDDAIAGVNTVYADGGPETEKLNDLARLQGAMSKMGIRENKHTQYTLPALNVVRKNFARHVRNKLAALNEEKELKDEYTARATALVGWVDETVPGLPRTFDNTLEGARAQQKEWNEYKVGESADKEEEKASLARLAKKIDSHLAAQGRPAFEPEAAVAPATIDAKWSELAAAEKSVDDSINAELERQEKVATLSRRLDNDAADLEAWLDGKEAYLAADEDTSSLRKARLALRVLAMNNEEVGVKRAGRLEDATSLQAQIAELNGARAAELGERVTAIQARFDALQAASDAKRAKLDGGLAAQQSVDDKASSFAEGAKDYIRFANNASETVGDYNFGADVEAVTAYEAQLEQDDAALRKDSADRKTALDALAGELDGVDNKYTTTGPADLAAASDKLEQALAARREAYAAERTKLETHDAKRKAFAEKANAFIEWVEAQAAQLKALDGEADARIEGAKAIYQEGKPNAGFIAELEALAEELEAERIHGNPYTDYSLPVCQARNKQYEASVANFLGGLVEEKEFNARAAEAAAAYEARQKREGVELEFRSKQQTLLQWIAGAQESLNAPIVASSPDDVAALRADYDKLVADEVPTNKALQQELVALAASANEAGAELSADGVTAEWSGLEAAVAARAQALDDEAAKQDQAEKLRLSFAEKAGAMNDFLATNANPATEGDIEQQLAALSHQLNVVVTDGEPMLKAVEAAAAALSEAGITDNRHTELTDTYLKAEYEGLQKGLKERIDQVNQDIMAKAGKDISPEELAEYKELFDHFDRDRDNSVDKLEFKAVLQTLGEDPTDDDMDTIFKTVASEDGLVSFQEFVGYMQARAAKQDSKSDIIESFKMLAGDKEYISGDDLRRALPAEKVAFLTSQMPPYGDVEDGWDYVAWANSVVPE